MGGAGHNLREVYAQYFFSVLEAAHHQDEAGRRVAQQHLEDTLVASGSVLAPEPTASYAW